MSTYYNESPLWGNIKRIFKPWAGSMTKADILIDLLESGLVWYTEEAIKLEEGLTICHNNLKHTASLLLRDLGEENPQIEVNYMDVYSPKLRIRIECGHTQIERLIHSLCESITFWILQYPKTEDTLTLYKFYSTEGCKELIKEYAARSVAKSLRSIEKELVK